MVGVVGSSPIAPTNILHNIKHPVATLGAFFIINCSLIPILSNSQKVPQLENLNIKLLLAWVIN
jgi:hypothetical protein